MASVNGSTGTIQRPEVRPLKEISKGYTYFEEGDVLFAKITPCLQNGKHAAALNLINGFGFGTTEFHVIRARSHIIFEWVHRFLRQPHVLSQATKHFRGAVGQQRVPKEFLQQFPIPLPPLEEQRRIVAELDAQLALVERARRAAGEIMRAACALPGALMGEILPSKGQHLPHGWRWAKLGEVCEFLDYRRRPINQSERNTRKAGKSTEELYPYYGANGQVDVIDDYLFDEPAILLAEDGGFFGSVHKPIAYIVEGKYWVNNHAHVLRPTPIINIDFLHHALRIRPDVGSMVSGSTRGKLNQEIASSIPIPLPPLDEQQRIVAVLDARLAAAKSAQRASEQQIATLDGMRAALMRQAFAGAGL